MAFSRRVQDPAFPLVDEEGGRVLASTISASRHLATATSKQAAREMTMEEHCSSLWTVTKQEFEVSGPCGDQNQYTVRHRYTQQLAVIDERRMEALMDCMAAHSSFAASELAGALFEHALSEQQVLSFAQQYLIAPDVACLPPPATYFRLLRSIVECLAEVPTRAPTGRWW